MKERILYGWNLRRIWYLFIGGTVIAYAITAGEWWGALLGGYFAAMGLFNFGCASGNCATGDYIKGRRNNLRKAKDIPYEEIKAE